MQKQELVELEIGTWLRDHGRHLASGSSFLWMRWLNCVNDDYVEGCVCIMTGIIAGHRVLIGVVVFVSSSNIVLK